MAEHLVAPTQLSSGRASQGRLLVAVALSTCLVASTSFFVVHSSGSSTSALVERSGTQGPPPGFMDPVQYMDSQSHVRFVRNTAEAEDMYARNVRVNVPCSWGIKCQLHVRPTLRERTGGAWLGEGKVTPLHKVKPQRLTGPWEQKFAKNLPEPAGNGWGDVDRATGAAYRRGFEAETRLVKKVAAPTKSYFEDDSDQPILGQRAPVRAPLPHEIISPVTGITTHQLHEQLAEAKEQKKEDTLEKKAAAIKAKMAKMLDSYGEAAIKTDNGYHP